MKKLSLFLIFSICAFFLSAQSLGEKAFKENNPEEAVVQLEKEKSEGKISLSAWNYLGLAYYQLEEYDKSVEAFSEGLKTPGTNKKILSFNQGNSYYALGQYDKAADSYGLTLKMDGNFTQALLNRANAYLMCQNYEKAAADYTNFISLEPEDPQRESIEKLLELLKGEIARIEEEKILAEQEAARIAEEEKLMAEELERQRVEAEKKAEAERLEQERIAEEQRIAREKKEAEERKIEEEKQAAEAERRRKLLEDVANSLHNTDSTNMSSGAEDLIDYTQESELD